MSDDFDREALFNDIDKIMAQQGYSTITPPSAPIEVEASVDTQHVVPTMPSNLNDLVSRVAEQTTANPETSAPAQSFSQISNPAKPAAPVSGAAPGYLTEADVEAGLYQMPNSSGEHAYVTEADVEAGLYTAPEEKPAEPDTGVSYIKPMEDTQTLPNMPEPGPAPEPRTETVMPPDNDVMSMFTTIENPIDWSLDSADSADEIKEEEKDDRPVVSYLEGAQSDGYGVENVAFGDISVGVETESVEFSVGHPLLRLLRNILICVAAALILSLLITKFIAHHTAVDGSSMESTLSDGDQLIVEQLSYYFHDPQRFDVIVFPISSEDNYIKRIIGLPGETVQIRDGQVYINGNLLTDDHYGLEQMDDPGMAADTIYLQKDEYFVLGDNRNASVDSRFREVGLIKRGDIKGRAWLRFYPFGSFGTVR